MKWIRSRGRPMEDASKDNGDGFKWWFEDTPSAVRSTLGFETGVDTFEGRLPRPMKKNPFASPIPPLHTA